MSGNRVKLTDARIRNCPLPPPGKRCRLWDDEVHGLVCVITDKGTRSLMPSAKMLGGSRPVRRLTAHHGRKPEYERLDSGRTAMCIRIRLRTLLRQGGDVRIPQ